MRNQEAYARQGLRDGSVVLKRSCWLWWTGCSPTFCEFFPPGFWHKMPESQSPHHRPVSERAGLRAGTANPITSSPLLLPPESPRHCPPPQDPPFPCPRGPAAASLNTAGSGGSVEETVCVCWRVFTGRGHRCWDKEKAHPGGGRGCGDWPSYHEAEGVGVGTQFAQQSLLQAGEGLRGALGRGEGLPGGQEEILAEGEAQDVQILTAIAEGTGQRHENWAGGRLR